MRFPYTRSGNRIALLVIYAAFISFIGWSMCTPLRKLSYIGRCSDWNVGWTTESLVFDSRLGRFYFCWQRSDRFCCTHSVISNRYRVCAWESSVASSISNRN
jgi:hypothetical protein